MCRAGASWAQDDLLGKNPSLKIRVYAVWFDVLPGDARERWDPTLLTDPRATQYWDADGISGKWFASNVTGKRGFAWDAYFLYAPGSRWGKVPTGLLTFSSPVISGRSVIAKSLHL